MIQNTLQEKIKDALKAKDVVRTSTLRLLLSALNNEKIAKMHELSEEEELAVVKRQLKQREEAVEALRQAQGKLTSSSTSDLDSRIEQETQEAEILQEFLPEQLSEEEVGQIVNQVVEELGVSRMVDFGRVMGEAVKRAAGKADGKVIAEIVKSKLS